MHGRERRARLAMPALWLFLLALTLVPAAAAATTDGHPHFPRPELLQPNVQFWKQVYTEYGVGDFVLHDRENLGLIYEVVRVNERASQGRAAALAQPQIDRARAKYETILAGLAQGASPETLGPEGQRVASLWGCPCEAERLLKAAGNIRVQQGLREKVDEGLHRAKGLLPRILPILRRHDVPVELAALPLVESTFNPRAESKAGAVGLWQFMRGTAKRYMKVTRKRDDRRDPIRATEAAARFLRHNYEALGSWPLAIVAYNHGSAGIQAASAVVGSRAIEDIIARYAGPRFGFASRNFYAEFLAALEVVNPFILTHARPLEAKSLQRSVPRAQTVALPAKTKRPAAAPATFSPAPPVAPAPAEAAPPAALPAAPAVPAGAEAPSPAEPPVEVLVPPAASPSSGEMPPAVPETPAPAPLDPAVEASVPPATAPAAPEADPKAEQAGPPTLEPETSTLPPSTSTPEPETLNPEPAASNLEPGTSNL